MSYTTTTDVEVSFGRSLTSEQSTQATALITRAELIIARRITDLATRITADPALEDVVVMVVSDAVARVLRNPDGVYQEQVDDYSFTRDRDVSSGSLHITDAEWDMLLAAPGVGSDSDAFTIRPFGEPGYATEPSLWWESPTALGQP